MIYIVCYTTDISFLLNPLRAAGEKSGQYGASSSHGRREKSTGKHQPISEGISWHILAISCIVSSHTGPRKIAKEVSVQVTTNDMMVAEQVSHKQGPKL